MALAVSYLPQTSILEMTTVNSFDKYFLVDSHFCHFPLRSWGMILCTYLFLWWGSPGTGGAAWRIKLTTPRTEAPHTHCFWARSFDTQPLFRDIQPKTLILEKSSVSIVNHAVCWHPARLRLVRVALGALKKQVCVKCVWASVFVKKNMAVL